jgi:D-glycerate 3-kinase
VTPCVADFRSDLCTSIGDRLKAQVRKPLVVGISGAQGSGKSTLADKIALQLRRDGLSVATLSLDDLYLTRSEREALGQVVHPLLKVRGVPGTHDVGLGLSIFADIEAGRTLLLPRFDKALDNRAPVERWTRVSHPLDVLIFEGWCVGARPQPFSSLAEPVNALEREQDRSGKWRQFANEALATDYQRLFARIHFQIFLEAPAWEVVLNWRIQQEQDLRCKSTGHSCAVMDDQEVERFVQHYERLTRHMLDEMPKRADFTIVLEPDRSWGASKSVKQ